MGRIGRSGDYTEAFLQMPADDDLGGGLAVRIGNGVDDRVAENFTVAVTTAEREPAFNVDLDIFDELGWIAAHDGAGCNVFGYNRTRGYYSILADGYTGKDGRSCAYPGVAADMHRLAKEDGPVLKVVVVGDELHVGCDHRAVFDSDAPAGHHQAVVHYHHVAANTDFVETYAGEAGHHGCTFSEVLAEQFTNQCIILVREGHCVVEFEKDLSLAYTFGVLFGGRLSGIYSECFHIFGRFCFWCKGKGLLPAHHYPKYGMIYPFFRFAGKCVYLLCKAAQSDARLPDL